MADYDPLEYSRTPTGRKQGEAGSLQPGMTSLLERRQLVSDEADAQRREGSLYGRLFRQLDRASRRRDIDAGFGAVKLLGYANANGIDVPMGIQSAAGNRAYAAQTLMDRSEQTEMLRGGGQAAANTATASSDPFSGPAMSVTANGWESTGVSEVGTPAASPEAPAMPVSGQVSSGSLLDRVTQPVGNGALWQGDDGKRMLTDSSGRVFGSSRPGISAVPAMPSSGRKMWFDR